MLLDKVVSYFLPQKLRQQRTHPQYDEFRIVVSSIVISLPLVLLFPLLIGFLHKPTGGFYVNAAFLALTLLSVKLFGHYRLPMSLTALVTYFIIYEWIRDTGFIYSSNVSILHMYLLGAIWADKKYGWWAIFTNLALFVYIYYQTLNAGLPAPVHSSLGGPLYALIMNCLITVFFGGFLAYLQLDQERDRAKIKCLQDQRISELDEAVRKRTEQLNTMRENIANDFHDETGNMLSAITRQAATLKLKLAQDHNVQPVVDSIIQNSNGLYAISKDFLWHLNHNSDDPRELFEYLTGYGQLYYNQFDIAFSATAEECHLKQFAPSAALNIIYIFKEAMTNVVKHAGAAEVMFGMKCDEHNINYILQDDGKWKSADEATSHYGLSNMERRCRKNGFQFTLLGQEQGTRIEVRIPVNSLV